MTTAIQRKLPGKPRAREEALREYNEHNAEVRKRIAEKFPDSGSVFWPFWAPDPDEFHRWRLLLDCGHIAEVLTGGRGRLPLGPWKPHSLPDHGEYAEGQYPCYEEDCLRGPRTPERLRDITSWDSRCKEDRVLDPDPEDPPAWFADGPEDKDKAAEMWAKFRHAGPRVRARWNVTLSCGHHEIQMSDPDWKPEDGIKRDLHPDAARARRRQEILDSDLYEGTKRLARDHFPKPTPWTDCLLCAWSKTIMAYEYAGPLVPPPPEPRKPRKPSDPRTVLKRRLRAAEREARQLRDDLAALDKKG